MRKDGIYQQFGVQRRASLSRGGRYPWWCRVDGVDHDGPLVEWWLDGWPPLSLRRDDLLGDDDCTAAGQTTGRAWITNVLHVVKPCRS